MSVCDRVGCDMTAKWRVGFRLWAVGHPKTSRGVEITTGVVLCDHHKREPGPVGDFFTPEGRQRISEAFANRRKAPLDFDGGEWRFTELRDSKKSLV